MSGCALANAIKKTLVTVTIATQDKAAVAELIALSTSSAADAWSALTNVSAIINSAGQPFVQCTATLLVNQPVQLVIPAPSPSPPSRPPFSHTLSAAGLDVLDFVNVTNPTGKALTQLLTAAAPTVQAAMAAAVASAVTASSIGALLGGGVGASVGPATLGTAQRNAMMAMLGGPASSCTDPRATGNGGGWTMGRFGVGNSHNPCITNNQTTGASDATGSAGIRRELQSRGGDRTGSKNNNNNNRQPPPPPPSNDQMFVANDEEEDLEMRLLVVALVDTTTSVAMIIGCVVGAHLLILVMWKLCLNRRYYLWVGRSPARVVLIEKEANERLGIGIAGDTVATVDAGSLCARVLSAGDRIHALNGQRLSGTSQQTSVLIRKSRQLTLLVSAPLPQPTSSFNNDTEKGPFPTAVVIAAGFKGGARARTQVYPMPSETPELEFTPLDMPNVYPMHLDVDVKTVNAIAALLQAAWRRRQVQTRIARVQQKQREHELASRVATKLQSAVRRRKAQEAYRATRAAIRVQKAWRRLHALPASSAVTLLTASIKGASAPSEPTMELVVEMHQPPMTPPPSPPSGTSAAYRTRAVVLPIQKLPNDKTRALYTKVAHELTLCPAFKGLPEFLLWPNLEVTFISSFSTGLVACASSVLGAVITGYSTNPGSLVLAIVVLVFVAAVYIWQLKRLLAFMRYHNDACWQEGEQPESKAEIDDPLYACLTNVTRGCIRPTLRERGSFEPPDEDAEEPGRTERALDRTFSLSLIDARAMRHGDALAELPTWLGDSSGSKRGLWYLFVQILLQLITAVTVGVTCSLLWSQSSTGSKVCLVRHLGPERDLLTAQLSPNSNAVPTPLVSYHPQ